MRRWNHNHRAVYDMVRSGKVGKPHIIKISSRDPEPPPVSYVKVSGGIFIDMAIHNFDMARFLAGDVDTAVVTLKFKGGTIGIIDNSKKAVYGYDQRVEVFGEKGVAMNSNDIPNTATFADANSTVGSTAYQNNRHGRTLSRAYGGGQVLLVNLIPSKTIRGLSDGRPTFLPVR